MRQLRLEGWIHHLGRHAVACFLTRGGCYIDWERGAEVFEEWLIDHEVACNTGNWQWLSCTAFYSQFYRCYSPVAFPKKTDAKGDFVRHFCPELKDYPDKYIYEPWKAPIADQKKAGCLVKGDGQQTEDGGTKLYPKPMFDFSARRSICIDAMKSAYHVNLYGDNPKVKDGSWRELFPDSAEGPTEGKSAEDATHCEETGREKRLKGGEEASGDMGVDQDEGEAAGVGGETKGGDREGEGKSPGKRKRKGREQGTLDVHFGGKRTKR